MRAPSVAAAHIHAAMKASIRTEAMGLRMGQGFLLVCATLAPLDRAVFRMI
jgi:hypothetical protein